MTIFEECDPAFLHDLVLKTQTYIFTPGVMVVRKGEIAREMFIIADGHLDVIGNKGKMIARLSTGNFFGEIGILNLDGGINRYVSNIVIIQCPSHLHAAAVITPLGRVKYSIYLISPSTCRLLFILCLCCNSLAFFDI